MIISGREFGEFTLDIPINLKNYQISNINNVKINDKKGIKYIEFELENLCDIEINCDKNEEKEEKEEKK